MASLDYTKVLTRVTESGPFYVAVTDPASGSSRVATSVRTGVDFPAYGTTGSTFAALAGGLTVFAGVDANGEQEPWVTDGTSGGTFRIAALHPGGSNGYSLGMFSRGLGTVKGSAAGGFASLDPGHVLFTASGQDNQGHLWITDGTAAGTRVVSDSVPQSGASYTTPPSVAALGNGRAVFASSSPLGGELYVTDGTAAGTVLLSDLYPSNSSDPTFFAAIGAGRAMFTARDAAGLAAWVTDGTAAGTRRVAGLDAPQQYTPLGNGLVVFENGDAAHGNEPWVTDGTAAGTRLLLDTVAGPGSGLQASPANGFGRLGDGRAAFLVSGSGSSGSQTLDEQLWVTDGTAGGTRLVADLGQQAVGGSTGRTDSGFVSLADGRVAFYGNGGGNATLWVSDGTAAGTRPIGGGSASLTLGGLSGAGLVDAPFYYDRYSDVAGAGVNAAQHYAASGWREGRDPDALFSTAAYRSYYKDVGAAGIDPLAHYDQSGWREGRDPSAAFDSTLYLLFNPDVRAAGVDPLAHYLSNGQVEGRRTSAVVDSGAVRNLFDPTFYGLSNPDVAAAGVDLAAHFASNGAAEGRNPDAYFDVGFYLRQNSDVAAAGVNPLAHYLLNGWREGRDPSAAFSTGKYLAAYSDVKAAGVNPLEHFLRSGIIEGRSAFGG